MKKYRWTLFLVFGVFAATNILKIESASAHDDLTVVSWGGVYTKSQMLASVLPFIKETGISVDVVDYAGGLAQIRDQVEAHNVKWDVVDLLLSDAIRGCEEGLLERIDPSTPAPAPDGKPSSEDFIPGTLRDCAVGSVVWSTVVAYDKSRFTGRYPKTITDFFDVEGFPGTRGLQKTPRVNLEWALLADGVPANQVYEVLATPEGLDRAFGKLDQLRPYVHWWENGSEPPRLFAEGTVSMSSAYNGRIHDAVLEKGLDLQIIWDGQVWDIDLWGIPKGTRDLQAALQFIRFATESQRLAEQAKYIAYGPARKSSMALIDDAIKPHLPTATENLENALEFNSAWWADNEDRLVRRFDAWLQKPVSLPNSLSR
jgi:putative spermidine/putrescine transport system substrate-binding protein